MAFLTDDDYTPHIKSELLTRITEGAAANRTKMEAIVQEEISMALRVRYDVPNVFNKAGAARNAYLVEMMVNMVIYKLSKKLSPGQVSETIRENYNNAKQDLDKLSSGSFEIDLPVVGDQDDDGDDDKSVIQWGSSPPRNPYY